MSMIRQYFLVRNAQFCQANDRRLVPPHGKIPTFAAVMYRFGLGEGNGVIAKSV